MARQITLPKVDPDPPQVALVREKPVSLSSVYKSLTADELKSLFAGINFPTPPMTHQLASLAWALDGRDRCMFWLDVGLGKSLLALYQAKLWDCRKVFVVCPNSVIWTWVDQISEHCPPAMNSDDTYKPGYQSWLFHSYPLFGETAKRRATYDHFLGLDIPAVGIINYEGLRYLFGIGKNMEQERSLNIGEAGVDCLILDECFPYETSVVTRRGLLSIGEIVETQKSVEVLSYDVVSNTSCWRKIKRYIRKKTQTGLVRVRHSMGSFVCTPNHKIYTNLGYIRADRLSSLHSLWFCSMMDKEDNISSEILHETMPVVSSKSSKREKREVLFSSVFQQSLGSGLERRNSKSSCGEANQKTGIAKKSRNEKEGQGRTRTLSKTPSKVGATKVLSLVREGVSSWAKRTGSREQTLLLSVLWDALSLFHSRLCRSVQNSGVSRQNKSWAEEELCLQSATGEGYINKNDFEQPSGQSGCSREDRAGEQRTYLLGSGGQWENYARAEDGCRSAIFADGGSNPDHFSEGSVQVSSDVLQSGCGRRTNESGNRNRWSDSQVEKVEVFRQTERVSFVCSRVVGVEVYKREGEERLAGGSEPDSFVYNLEVEGEHNYFADGVLVSNCHHVKNPNSVQTQILEALSDSVPHVIGLTGTAIERNVVDLWAQYRIVDGGMSLGPSHRTFLSLWCDQVGDRWYPKASATDKVLALVEPRTLRYSKAECVDLPPIIYEPVYLPLSAAQQDEIDCATEEVKNLRQAEALGMQFQKVCGGISLVKVEDGDPEPFFDEIPKIDALFELLDVLGEKVVVYHFFVDEGRLLERECKKRGVTYTALRGEVKDKKGSIKTFCENPSIRLLIANSDCGSEGLNLQKATSQIVNYSRNWRQITRTQTEGRIHRVGQTETCVVIDLLHRGTIDEVIYNCVKNKKDAAEEILKWMGDK